MLASHPLFLKVDDASTHYVVIEVNKYAGLTLNLMPDLNSFCLNDLKFFSYSSASFTHNLAHLKKSLCPDWYGSVVWALSCRVKGRLFDSGQGAGCVPLVGPLMRVS